MSTAYRRALVIGLGASGRAAIRLLTAMGVQVHAYDQREVVDDAPAGVTLFLGTEVPCPEAFEDVDLMVLSPGVPPGPHRAACQAHAPDAKIHGELSLALEALGALPTVLITGTNGKSTVTSMLGHLLRADGHTPFVGGNLGDPPAELARAVLRGERQAPSALVLECSSYQLETLEPGPTAVAMVLNVTPDHLDRYDSYEDYAMTKARVFENVAGLALLDADDEWTPRFAPLAGARLRLVGSDFARIQGEGPGDALVVDGQTYARSALRLPGRHNAKNALFAIAAAQHLGVSAATIRGALPTFEGLPHRMVFVRELGGVKYFNDSKATNVASAMASLGGLRERFVLIAGGRAKGDDLAPLGELLRRRGRGLVTVGEAGPRFAALAADHLPHASAESMAEAVQAARRLAEPGDLVLLAPACSSFDQYRSYAQRGERFTEAVLALE
ncbi:MAG: UDP-N-acetylmuramoyl-L-alanine--D-glutamate ligase [Nannocystaceae bacterium]|nr:UDP-N-acetylmuramoyl-L-alanine--D-glutamate ligase [bacterium]